MPFTKDDLDAFRQFAESQLAKRGAESLRQLVDAWEVEYPPAQTHAANVAAIRASIRDMERGERGRPADEVIAEVRRELASRRES